MSEKKQRSDRGLVKELSARIDEVLGGLLEPAQRVALINFPNHSNAGDSAVWLGERASLRRLGQQIIYQASWASYRRDDLAKVLGENDVILINGGGNFGDLYQHNQEVIRGRVLRDFRMTRTIQLPQSIWFQKSENLARAKSLCENHNNFTLMVRDLQSLNFAKEKLSVPTLLCPDMALAMGPLPRAREPRADILWLARADIEASGYEAPKGERDVEVVDWLTQLPDEDRWSGSARFMNAINQHLHQVAQRENSGSAPGRMLLAATFTSMAKSWAGRGCSVLSRGKVVVTDRLHGHLLSMMMDIPHVLIDNSYGKVRSMYETWTKAGGNVHWADGPEDALSIARALVDVSYAAPLSPSLK